MKILIIGGGIGGFAMYHALRKHLPESSATIKIYEAYPSAAATKSNVGGGLGLAPNGLRALASLSKDISDHIQANGLSEPTINLRNSNGRLVGCVSGGRKERYGFDQMFLPRAVVHDAVFIGVPDGVVEWQKKVREVRETKHGVEVEFEDGTVEEGDLVIGADGVKSVVREAIFGDKYPVQYDGLTGVGGSLPVHTLPEPLRKSLEREPVTMTFGPHGFFGYAVSTPRSADADKQQMMWWSTWEADPAPDRHALLADIRSQLLERHDLWKSPHDAPDAPVFPTIISLACSSESDTSGTMTAAEKNVLILPRRVTPRLPGWSNASGKIIIMGDSAHAMPPDVGQGVSCAAEDAVAIALLLKHYLSQGAATDIDLDVVLKSTAKSYEELRMKRLAFILDSAKHAGNSKRKLKKWQEILRDSFVWLFTKLPESINDSRLGYDVEAEVKKYLLKKSRR